MKNVTPWNLIDYIPGQQITRPGIYSGVPNEEYHRRKDLLPGPSISSGPLRRLEDPDVSLEHFFMSYPGNPDFVREPDKAAWVFGRAAHTLLLGESGFREDYLIRPEMQPANPDKPWNGNEGSCRKWLAEAALARKTVLKSNDVENIRGMAAKLATHPVVQAGILNGLVEKSIFWRRRVKLPDGRVQEIWLKSRPDVIPIDSAMVVDFKSCDSAGPIAIRLALGDYGLHQQMALAAQGILAVSGRRMTDFTLVFQEKEPPYSINHTPVSPLAIEYGHRQNERALLKFAQAVADNHWPGFEDDEEEAGLPEWLMRRLSRDAEKGLLPPPPSDEEVSDLATDADAAEAYDPETI